MQITDTLGLSIFTVVPFTMPFSCPPEKLLPVLRSLHIAYNPLKSEYVEKLDKEDVKTTMSRFNYNSKTEESKTSDLDLFGNNEDSEAFIEENGPMTRIERLDLSGIDTQSINVCNLLSQLPKLKVI